MENKQQSGSEGSSICSDLDKLNLADFGLEEDFEAKSNDGNDGEIEKIKVELVKLKKEMEAMKLANKSDSDEIANKLEGKIDHLEKYVNDQFQKLVQENQKQSEKYIRDDHLKMIVEKLKEAAQQYGFGPLELPKEEGYHQSKQNESALMDMAKQREIVQDVQNLQSIKQCEMSGTMNQEERDMLSRSQHPLYRDAYIRGRQCIDSLRVGRRT